MIFETHAHYDDEAFDGDRDELLLQLRKAGIGRIVNVAANIKGCKDGLALSSCHEGLYCSMGVHPSDTGELSQKDLAWMEAECLEHSVRQGGKVVAVGEIGLDYYWDEPERAIQKQWFEAQIEMARRVKLPLIIHSREAAQDTMEIMKRLHTEEMGGIIHCYSYSVELAREFLDMGFYFGIGGVITFHNAKKLVEVVKYLPLDRIVLETDSPYLAPVPNRGKRNSSLNLPYVAAKIAELKDISEDEVIRQTYRNAQQVYGLAEI